MNSAGYALRFWPFSSKQPRMVAAARTRRPKIPIGNSFTRRCWLPYARIRVRAIGTTACQVVKPATLDSDSPLYGGVKISEAKP
jgi:hypothetical protein